MDVEDHSEALAVHLVAIKLEAAKHARPSITSVSVSLSLFLLEQCTLGNCAEIHEVAETHVCDLDNRILVTHRRILSGLIFL